VIVLAPLGRTGEPRRHWDGRTARTREALAGFVEAPEAAGLLRSALQSYRRLGARSHADRVATLLTRRTSS